MSIITTFPGIRGSVVYHFFYEIDHYFFLPYWVCFDLMIVLLRETRVSPRAPVLYRALLRSACYTAMSRLRCFQAPPKGTRVLICKLHMETKWKVRTYLFCSCTKIKSAGIWWTFGQWGGVRAHFCAPIHSRVVKNKRINVCGQTIHV